MRLLRDTCRSIRDLLPLHVGGDLDASQARRVDEHLHVCLTCFRDYRELATMRGRLGVLAEQPLPAGALDDFTEQVMARIAQGEDGPAADLPGVRRGIVLPTRTLAAAASLILALSLGLALGARWSSSPSAGEATPAQVTASEDALPAAPASPVASGEPATATLPSLGIPVGDFRTSAGAGAGARRKPRVAVPQPVFEPGVPTISSRDREVMQAFIPALRSMLLDGSADGLVPDTDPDRQLRLRHPGRDDDG